MVCDIVGSWEMVSVRGIDCDSETEEDTEDEGAMELEDVAEAGREAENEEDIVGSREVESVCGIDLDSEIAAEGEDEAVMGSVVVGEADKEVD